MEFKKGDIVVRTCNNPHRPELIAGNRYEVTEIPRSGRVNLKGIRMMADAEKFTLDKNQIVINILNDL